MIIFKINPISFFIIHNFPPSAMFIDVFDICRFFSRLIKAVPPTDKPMQLLLIVVIIDISYVSESVAKIRINK